MFTKPGTVTMCACILFLACGKSSGDVPGFTGVGQDTLVYEVAVNGSKLVGRDADGQAAYWTSVGGWSSLGFYGYAYSVSRDGAAITGWSGASESTISSNRGFLWTPANGVEWIGDLPGDGSGTLPMGISADGGTIVGDSQSTHSSREAFRWTRAGGMVGLAADLGNPGYCRGTSVSGDGTRIVVENEVSFGTLDGGWLWQNGSAAVTFPATFTPWKISADGTTIIAQGSRWTAGTGVVSLGSITGGSGYSARDVSGDGSIITGYCDINSDQTAFIWDSTHGIRPLKNVLAQDYGLDLTGWTLRWAYVSDDGLTFTGVGINPDGMNESWVATIPEPATLALLAVGGLAMLRRRRK